MWEIEEKLGKQCEGFDCPDPRYSTEGSTTHCSLQATEVVRGMNLCTKHAKQLLEGKETYRSHTLKNFFVSF